MRFWGLVILIFALVAFTPRAKAQIQIPGTDFTLIPVNGGTGGLVSVPIPGGSGLSVTVGTGSAALPLQGINNNPNAVNITTSDDWYNEVPLGFTFPFFGQNFTTSWAATNGFVTFKNPQTSGLWGGCCEGVDLRTTKDSRYNYTIYGMHTDLYSWNGQNQYYLRGTNEMTYGWYNISQCCGSQGGNSFEIKINSAGLIDTRIAGGMVSWNRVTSGMAGDLLKGEYFQAYHGQGINIIPGSANIFSWQALGGTGGVDLCLTNPLSSPSCPNYATAYLSQQCTISALYDPSCPGYAAAYFTQQCTANPLYNVNCPGYAAAYLDYQCSINALYSTTCAGYEQAYFNQQCSLNGLYSRQCPNYAEAYATKMLLEQQGTASIVATAGVIAQTSPTSTTASTTTASTTISSDGAVSVGVSKTGDSNVDKAIASPAPTTNSAAAPSAPVQLVAPPPAPAAPQQMAQNEPRGGNKQEDKKDDAPKSTGGNSPSQNTGSSTASSDKPAAPTARQELQARREAAAKAEAVEKGKNLAGEMGKADNMEQQKQIQNVVIQAMGFTPGFDNYGKAMLPDVAGYKPYAVYTNQKNIENRSTLRMFGGTDSVHQQMIESQYKR